MQDIGRANKRKIDIGNRNRELRTGMWIFLPKAVFLLNIIRPEAFCRYCLLCTGDSLLILPPYFIEF